MKKFLLLFFVLMLLNEAKILAQLSRYIIQLNNKNNTPYSINDPHQFLSLRSIDRRAQYNIPLDSTDLPINPSYIDSIRLSGNVSILNVSKWLNMVCIKTTDATAINKINSFSFVNTVKPLAARLKKNTAVNKELILEEKDASVTLRTQQVNNFYSYGQAYNQIHLNNGEFLHNHGFRGEQMQLAIIDAGFYHYKTLPTFDSVRINNQIAGTWDFVANEESVNEDYLHGMNCFSTIAANLPGTFVGTAPKATFYLYRTEDAFTETIIEELNWAAGAEKADSAGVNVISSSLGYNTFDGGTGNHTYSDLNGDITISAKATDLAAKKGILVLLAAGNEGMNSWHYITTPADADSCIAVGAVDINKNVADFSSYGPSSDGQVKPDIAALGVNAIIANTSTGLPEQGNGTSFATPIIAGITTCLWQAFPEVNNMAIINALRRSGNIFTTPNNRIGYGVPDAKKAFVHLIKQLHTTDAVINNCSVNINWTVKCAADMNFVVERKLPADIDFLPIEVKTDTGNFASKYFSFNDDLSSISPASNALYRIKMTIASDTSFYLDTVSLFYSTPCNVYTFIGDGNWDIPANWSSNIIPPDTLAADNTIIIDPVSNGECILNITQHISKGAIFIIKENKKFVVPGELKIEE